MVRDTRRKQDKKNKKTIVCKIYANWCGHCQTLKPIWAELKNMMHTDKNITMIEIEESEMKEKIGKLRNICKKNIDVNGFPTIVKICGKKVEYYQGERSVDAMRAWIMPTKGSHMPSKRIQGGKNKTQRRRN